jgi:hypothetical protein
MHLGTCIAMFAGLRQGDIMDLAEVDTTNPHRKMRRTRSRIPGVMYKTRVWFEEVGAEAKPQKMVRRSAYLKTQDNYWYYLELGQLDRAVLNRERAQRISIYVKSPDPK